MVKRTRNSDSKQKTFILKLEPVNDFISTDDLKRKLRLMAGGCGLRVVSAEQFDESEPEEEKEH